MSGGHFNYTDETAKNEIFGWTDKPVNVFEDREISELIWDVFELIHDFDWYMSGDTDRKDYLASKAKFKAKWLKSDKSSAQRIIDEAIEELKQELYETYNINDA